MTMTDVQSDQNYTHSSSPLLSPDGLADEENVANVDSYYSDIWARSPALPLTAFEDDATCEQQDLLSMASSVHSESNRYGSIKLLEAWFPKINPEHPRAHTWRTWTAQRQVVLWGCFAAVSSVCLINLSLAIWAWVHFGTASDGVVELYHGNCAIVKRADALAHIGINILGSLLLGASNLTLQLLVAPTRKEVDAAHAKGTWLDIGVPSLRNLRGIPRSRAMLWSLLAITSMPIIALYNSTIFSSLSINDISVAVITEEFLTVSNWTASKLGNWSDILEAAKSNEPRSQKRATVDESYDYHKDSTWHESRIDELYTDYQKDPAQYRNHTIYEYLKTYMNPYDWRPLMLILISSDTESFLHLNSSILLQWEMIRPDPEHEKYPLCSKSPGFITKCASLGSLNSENIGTYTYKGNKIDYALYKDMDPIQSKMKKCYLHGSPQILMVVSFFNLIKCLCILKVTWSTHGATLCILGDAIASFLETPDLTTKGLGIISRKQIAEEGKSWSMRHGRVIRWKPRPIRWRHAVAFRQWAFVIFLTVAILVASWTLIIVGFHTQRLNYRSITLKSLWARGFGKTTADQIVNFEQPKEGNWGTFVNVMMANTFQVLISLAYVAYNGLISCMLVADEWCGFAKDRKTLRVSAPVGMQRSSYSLSMPLCYGIPMMIISLFAHWLVSQSVFVVRVNKLDYNGDRGRGWTVSGYSLMPSLIAVNLGFLHLIFHIIHANLRKYPVDCAMPLASTCSAAISAACHRPEADKEAHLLPVQWGVVGTDEQDREYCSFTTSRDVVAPSTGSFYLGMSSSSSEAEMLTDELDRESQVNA